MRLNSPAIETALLAFWLGAAVLFAAAVAPAVFAVLPTRTLAGAVVGRVLPTIFYSGMIAGAAVVLLEFREKGEWSWRGREAAGAVMLASCVAGQLFIAPRIERLRSEIGGVLEALAADDPRRAAFGRLHGASVAWLGVAMLAAAAGLIIAVRRLRHD